MIAQEVMTRNPVHVDVSTPIQEAIEQLIELDVRHLPITDRDQLVGIISDRDVRPFMSMVPIEPEARAELERKLEQPVASLMQGAVYSVHIESELEELIDTMIDQKIGAVPVINDQRRLVGIISTIDLLKIAQF
jgi:CBS domain-containing protein